MRNQASFALFLTAVYVIGVAALYYVSIPVRIDLQHERTDLKEVRYSTISVHGHVTVDIESYQHFKIVSMSAPDTVLVDSTDKSDDPPLTWDYRGYHTAPGTQLLNGEWVIQSSGDMWYRFYPAENGVVVLSNDTRTTIILFVIGTIVYFAALYIYLRWW